MAVVLPVAGRPANSDRWVARQIDVTNRFNETQVDQAYVDSAVDSRAQALALKSYVDSRDSNYATVTSVDSADANYVSRSLFDVASGIPSLDGSGLVQGGQMPTTRPDRVAQWFGISRWYLSGSAQTGDTGESGIRICEIAYTDPGWPYIPIVFGNFLTKGEEYQSFAKMNAKIGSGNIWGWGVGTALLEWHSTQVYPFAYTSDAGQRTYSGSGTLTFWANKFAGNGNVSVSSVNGFGGLILFPAIT